MPEFDFPSARRVRRDTRTFASPRRPARARSLLSVLSVCAVALLAAACTESLDGGDTCPVLCPQEPQPFRDTIVDGVVAAGFVGPFPVLGLTSQVLLADRGDTLQTDVVVRFDALPSTFLENGTGSPVDITAIDSSVLRLQFDTLLLRENGPFTLQVFDVDTTESDSVSSVVRSLFRPDRLITSLVIDPDTLVDSLRVPFPDSLLLQRIVAQQRLRLGLRVVEGAGGPLTGDGGVQLRLAAFAGGFPFIRLRFDPSTDTTYRPIEAFASTTLDGADEDDARVLAYTTYTLPRATSPVALPAGTLRIGGLPGDRTYLRFDVPASIVDSSTVVRAELVLTQRPARSVDAFDTIAVLPLIGTANERITDPFRIASLVADGAFALLDSLRLVPADSGARVLNLVTLVRSWRGLPADVPRVLVLRLSGEGSRAEEVWIHGVDAGAAVRPRLRLTYQPRSEFALP